ncbi:MAG: LL-diaminopimelate aminotransferase [Vampirovibrionales bacterium]
MPHPSKRLETLPPYLFAEIDRKIDEAKAKGVDIISLGIGDPDLPTPEAVVEAMCAATRNPTNHNYPPYQGTLAFREAASRWMKQRFTVDADAHTETLALIGSKEGLAHLILAYVDAGDVVLCPSIGYPVYANYTRMCEGEAYMMSLKPENGYLPVLREIPEDVARRAKIMFLNYPNNPLGAIATEAFIQEAVDFCKQHDILLCHDHAYSEMTFDGYKAPSFLSAKGAKDVVIEFFSLSKMFNMTGWRVGFAVGNPEAVKVLGTLKNNTDSGVFKAIQDASIVALDQADELTRDLNAIYGKRRDLFVEGLQALGWPYEKPVATFYLWVPVPQGWKSVEFVNHLLETCGIVVPPGNGYGAEGEGFFRVALTVPETKLQAAIDRMKAHNFRYDVLSRTPVSGAV